MTADARRCRGVRTLAPGLVVILAQTAAAQLAPEADLRAEFECAVAEFDEAQETQSTRPDRARQLFRLAAQRFSSIVAAGVVNGGLEYNLGNCYLQADDVGRAILHYRRAERLIPSNPLLADNLAVARSRCLTTIHPTRGSAFLRGVFFWHYRTSVTGRAKAALGFYIGIWIMLILRNFIPRRAITVTAIFCALLAGASAASVGTTYWLERNAPVGVVTEMDVAVHKGPGISYQRRFEQPLQPGVEFTLRQRRGGWWKIELADGESGWIEASRADLITRKSL